MTNTKKMYFIALLLSAIFAFSGSASAQANLLKNSDKPLYNMSENDKEKCFVYGKYVVKTVMKELTENTDDKSGDDISIFKRDASIAPQKSCETDGNALLSVANTEGNTFLGIFRDHLFIEKNIYPDYSNLEIYNLKTNKNVFAAEYTAWNDYKINIAGGRFLLYDSWSKKDGLIKNCPQGKKWKREGLGVSWIQNQRLDLQTFKVSPVGVLKCVSVN